jgi:hypothetical protein
MVNLEVPHFSTAAPLSATRRTFQPPFTGESWGHDSGQHATGGEAAANSAPDSGAATDTASDSGAATDAATATTHILGDIHVPFVGRVFKRATKGVVQGMLLWRLGRLTKRWLRMVE